MAETFVGTGFQPAPKLQILFLKNSICVFLAYLAITNTIS